MAVMRMKINRDHLSRRSIGQIAMLNLTKLKQISIVVWVITLITAVSGALMLCMKLFTSCSLFYIDEDGDDDDMDKHQRDEDDSEFGDGSYDDLYANASAHPIADSVPNSEESNSLNDNLHDTESRNGVNFYYFKFIYIVKLILEICSSRLQKKPSSLKLSKEDIEIVQATVLFL